MKKAKRIKDVEKRVKAILIEDPQARNSDSFLYLKVLKMIGKENGIDVESISIIKFLLDMSNSPFPPFESVRRARQKLQSAYPELRGCKAVEEARAENELEYREYVREVV